MGEPFFFQYSVGTGNPPIKGGVRLEDWGKKFVFELKNDIWDKLENELKNFDGVTVPERLNLWLFNESKPQESRLLDEEEELCSVVFPNASKKKVFVTPVGAENCNVAFVVKGTSVSQGVLGDTLELLRKMWGRLRTMSVDDYAAGKVVVVSEWPKLRALHFPPREGMYIRDSFSETFADLMYWFEEQEVNVVHLSGIPGIGKSTYLWYVLIRLAAHETYKGWTSLLELRDKYYVFLPDGSVRIHRNDEDDIIAIINRGNCWVLIDQRHQEGKPLGFRNIVFASPDEQNVKPTRKEGLMFLTMYFRPWTLEDFKEAGLKGKQEVTKVMDVWDLCEGVPRVLFEDKSVETMKQRLLEKIATVDFAAVENTIGSEVVRNNVPFCLFKFEVEEKSRSAKRTIHFASERIAFLYFEAAMNASRARVVQFLIDSTGMTEKAAMRGFIFEQYAVSWLTGTDIKLSVRMLQESGSRSVLLKLAKRELKVYNDVREMVNMGADAYKYLWRPYNPNNAGFDLLVPPRYLVEFTISRDKHPINHTGMKLGVRALRELEAIVAGNAQVLESGRCTKRYIFLGPPDTAGFGAQKLVFRNNTVKSIDPILRTVKQHHGVVILSNSREATGPYDKDEEEEIEPISGGGNCSELAHEPGDDDEEVQATSAEAAELKLKVLCDCEMQLAGLKRQKFFKADDVGGRNEMTDVRG
eukprot:TRINITY_DN255_c1_g1_i3.p1 TRINITY_DN255_c1_g1~~TRINITY_DN255_c1_g1_i3.p1  ORF type:complete len:697 (+),score=164.73 TRINITY_DN255_c1_g1_i3:159-2249(+)